jgi:hypothetical protein
LAKVFGYHSCIRGKKGGSVSKGELQRLKNFAHAKALSRKGFGRSAVDDSCIRGKKGGSVSKGELQRLKNFAHAKALSRKGLGRSAVDNSCICGKQGGWRLALAFGVAGWRGWTGNGFAPMALFWTHKIRPMPRASALGF